MSKYKNNSDLMSSKSKCKILFNHIMITIFLVHGLLYLFFPADIHNNLSPIKYIKYIVILMILIVNIKSLSFSKSYIYLFTVSILFLISYNFNKDFTIMQFITYAIPCTLLIFKWDFYESIELYYIIIGIVLLTSILGYVDFYKMRIFSKWFVGGEYREASIFINPNSMAITISFFSIYLIYYSKEYIFRYKKIFSLFTFINCTFLNVLSGSKTGLIAFIIIMVLFVIINLKNITLSKCIKIISAFIGTIIILFIGKNQSFLNTFSYYVSDYNIRKFSMLSGQIRESSNDLFLQLAKDNLFFPFFKTSIGIDNTYYHLWGTMGLLVLIIFILTNIYLIYDMIKNKEEFNFLSIIFFLMVGVTTNFLYLWPSAYIYFFIIARYITKKRRKKNDRLYYHNRDVLCYKKNM